jgi:AcrR family transcriptional regulator
MVTARTAQTPPPAAIQSLVPYLSGAADAPGKRRILHAALRLFARQGLDGTSIRQIAAAAHTTNPALYRHFVDKHALALHVFLVCYRELYGRLRAAIDGAQGFEARLAAFVDAFIAYHDEAPDAVLYIAEHVHRLWPRVPAEMKAQTVTLLARDLVLEGRAAGAVAPDLAERVRVLGVAGQLFQLARMIHLHLMDGPAQRWRDDLLTQLRRMLR